MCILLYATLLFCIIDDRNYISASAIDLLSFNDKNKIFNTIEHRAQIGQNHDSKKWKMKDNVNDLHTYQFCRSNPQNRLNNENNFLDIFTSKTDRNDTNLDIYCQQQITNSLNFLLEKTIHEFNKNLNIGGKFELNTESISMTLEKVSSNNITGKHLSQSNGAEVRIPQLNLNETITINLMTLPSSSIISLTLHDQSGKIINIKNTTNPFEILIPHQINTLMPPMIHQNITSFSNNTKFKYHYINLTHNLNLSISLHAEIEPKNPNISYLIIIRFSGMPDLQTNLIDESKLICPKDRKNDTLKYTYFIDNTRISHHQWAIIGIREMKECRKDNLNDNIQFSSDYSIRTYTSGCYYLDNNNNWQSDGLTVGSETNERFTQCYSTHLTTFAGGFIVLPPPIDWNLDFNPKNNLAIYLTLITIGLFYFITMGYSYNKDKIDAEMLMVIPLLDNNQRDTYLYQLVVFTGMRANAGTKSKVHFILSGNDDETNIRTLTANRRILDRGNTDSFIMATPRSLGELDYLRIWHDNSGSGSDASWYLKYILVRDLQTMETSYFICEKWFAVEKDSGEIDRTIGIAGELEKTELKHVLSKNAYRSMADNHLWFSIFAYHLPSANRFTRVQRCTCCFVLFLMSLLMNLYYYGLRTDDEDNELDQYGLTFGPFHISKKEISISVIVELIIFFPSLLLIALFRRSKARRPRKVSPVGEAIQNIQTQKSKNKNNSVKENKFLFPWWCIIIAYVLSVLMALTSVGFILIRSVQYGNEITSRWLGSIITSFCASVFLTQPMKVLSLSLLFMCLCRKKSQVDAFIEYEDPVEDFTVSTTDAHRKFPSKSLLAKTRLDPYRTKREKAALKKLREIRLKEVKAWFILRELFFLLLFLGILYAISFANRDVENAHRMVNYLRREFLQMDYRQQYKYNLKDMEKKYIFENIRSIDDYWDWIEKIFIKKYNETIWNDHNKKEIKDKSQELRNPRTNRIIGWPTLRQLRVKNDSCPRKALHDQMEIDDCNLPYTWYNEDKNPFRFNISTGSKGDVSQAFIYTPAEDKTLIYSTSYATYLAGGYVHEILGTNIEEIKFKLKDLREYNWIDRHTRAVFLTFDLYNPNINLFVYCSLLLEQLPKTLELILRPSFQPFKLVQLYTGTDLIYCLIYLILIIYYMYVEIKLIFQMRKAYIKQFWSYINWAIIFCSWFGVVIHIFRQTEMKKMANSLKEKEKSSVNLLFFSYLDSLLTYLLGFCCFFGTIKILRLLRFNRRMSLLHLTLAKSGRQILGFLVMFSFVFSAFTILFYLLFHSYLQQFSTWISTALTCFEMVSLHFSTVTDLKLVDPFLASLCLFLFSFLTIFVLSNMFISIIVDNFNAIRREELKKANEVELLRFTIDKIKQWIGMRARKQELEKTRNPVVEFPEKMDKLMIAIDKIYKDKKL